MNKYRIVLIAFVLALAAILLRTDGAGIVRVEPIGAANAPYLCFVMRVDGWPVSLSCAANGDYQQELAPAPPQEIHKAIGNL